jgi:type IV fimbrial biogenesis protein FimT
MISYYLRRSAFQFQSGFSLIELLTGLTVAGVLGSLSIGMSDMIGSHAITAEVNSLMTDLALARSESIKRRKTITLCTSSDGTSCSKSAAWRNGWIIFVDSNRNRKIDGEDQLLRNHGPLRTGSDLHYGSDYFHYVMYSGDGMVFPGATFTFCSKNGYRRAIIVYWSGRARVSNRGASGKELVCKVS